MDRAKRLAAPERLRNDAAFTSYSHQGDSKLTRVNNRFRVPFARRAPRAVLRWRGGPVKSFSREMSSSDPIAHVEHERRLQRLIRRLPGKIQAVTRWLRRPASRWARIPAGVLLIIGGRLSILPFLGLWDAAARTHPAGRRHPAAAPGARVGARLDGAAQAALVRRRRRPRGSDGRGGKQRIGLFAGTAAPCRRLTSCRFSPISKGPQSPWL
jgi:hypothetical protein